MLIAVALVLGAFVGGAVAWQLRAGRSASTGPSLPLSLSERTVVPYVVGMSPSDAAATLARWGLAGSVDPSIGSGVVVAQEPGAGQPVRVGSIVVLRGGNAPADVGASFRSFGTLSTRFGDAVMVCGAEAMPRCGTGTVLEFVGCSDPLLVYFRGYYAKASDGRVRDLIRRAPPSGDGWAWGCGRDFRRVIEIP